MNKQIVVLYIGSLAGWSNSLRRFKALKNLYPQTDVIDTDRYILPKLISSFQHHLNFGPGIYLLNRKIRTLSALKKYDLILVDNKPYLYAATLKYLKAKGSTLKIANILTDDPFGKFARSWPLLKKTARLYDVIFVQRQINIAELENIGAKQVKICYRSFDPAFNRPVELSATDRNEYACDVGFVGTYEDVRASFIAYLIQQGIAVSVRGNDWPGGLYWEIIKPHYKGPSIYEEEYVKALNGMDIALHFLRHANRDEQDSRTFELPASKVFMIAERSELHEQLFKEGEETTFFSTKEELLTKVKYFRLHPEQRSRMAEKAYERCFKDKYDHSSRMEFVVNEIVKVNSKHN